MTQCWHGTYHMHDTAPVYGTRTVCVFIVYGVESNFYGGTTNCHGTVIASQEVMTEQPILIEYGNVF